MGIRVKSHILHLGQQLWTLHNKFPDVIKTLKKIVQVSQLLNLTVQIKKETEKWAIKFWNHTEMRYSYIEIRLSIPFIMKAYYPREPTLCKV